MPLTVKQLCLFFVVMVIVRCSQHKPSIQQAHDVDSRLKQHCFNIESTSRACWSFSISVIPDGEAEPPRQPRFAAPRGRRGNLAPLEGIDVETQDAYDKRPPYPYFIMRESRFAAPRGKRLHINEENMEDNGLIFRAPRLGKRDLDEGRLKGGDTALFHQASKDLKDNIAQSESSKRVERSAPSDQQSFLRIRKSHPSDTTSFLRIGKSHPSDSTSFLRIGKSRPSDTTSFLRIGKSHPSDTTSFLRIGKSRPSDTTSFLRIGRAPSETSSFLRIGRTDTDPSSFLRIGRAPSETSSFLRIGRAPDSAGFLRIGRGNVFNLDDKALSGNFTPEELQLILENRERLLELLQKQQATLDENSDEEDGYFAFPRQGRAMSFYFPRMGRSGDDSNQATPCCDGLRSVYAVGKGSFDICHPVQNCCAGLEQRTKIIKEYVLTECARSEKLDNLRELINEDTLQ